MTLTAAQVTLTRTGVHGFRLPPTDLTVREGTISVLAGPSGSGKSTLAHLLVGLLTPETGSVTCDGDTVRRRRGRLPGHTALLDQDPMAAVDPRKSLWQLISLPARLRRHTVNPDALMREVGLDPMILDRRPDQVSGGQLQRVCLARALAQQPRYLIADEVTAHLDPDSTAAIAAVLRARADRGLGVLAITHDPALADGWADVVTVMDSQVDSVPFRPAPPGRTLRHSGRPRRH